MNIEEIFPSVFQLTTTYGKDTAGLLTDGAFPHTVWFITGPHPALLDPGPTVVAQETVATIKEMGFNPDSIEYIIPSHIHIDHGGGCGWLVKILPKAKAVIHSRGMAYMTEVSRLASGTAAVFGDDWIDIFGELLPIPNDRAVAVEDGSMFDLGGSPYKIIFMPGHSLDHIGVYDENNRALYCGHGLGNYMPDRLMPDPPMTLPYFNVAESLASIQKARELSPRYLLPVHTGFLAADPNFAIDAVERVTIALGEIIKEGMETGASPEETETVVKRYMFADPNKADRSYMPVVQAYSTYFEREQRRSANR
jgi:glyoxylase-like metal-dependent hydrolase (beta-lactamase superfamily II)